MVRFSSSFRLTLRTVVVAASPSAASVGVDLIRRSSTVTRLGLAGLARYGATALLSAALLGVLLVGTTDARPAWRWTSRVLFSALFILCVGSQGYFHQQYATYLNLDAVTFGAAFRSTVTTELLRDARGLSMAHVGPAVIALLLLLLAARLLPRRRLPAALPGVPFAAMLGLAVLPVAYRGTQAAVPEVLAVHAVLGFARAKAGLSSRGPHALPGRRSPEYLPALVTQSPRPRNVVFVITESVRADAFCSDFDPACAMTPDSNRAAPGRLALRQMRANDSATAVSVAVLLTGLPPTASRHDLHSASTVWEYAAAAGWDTAYWTSQNLLFGNSDMFVRDIGVEKRISATELDPAADLDLGSDDGELSAYVQSQLPRLREPYLAVVHYSNTHFPYLVRDGVGPFQPAAVTKDPAETVAFYNHYKNAVFLQDRAIGALLRAIRASPAGERTVVVFTSDHGEAFREHGQIGHTLSVYDEEVRVPAFVDAPPGTLSAEERAHLVEHQDAPVFHTDIVPTLLDLLGVGQAPQLGRTRARMPGTSLLAARAPSRFVPLTNCAAVWGCPFKNWGGMLGSLKLEAREWDAGWHCFDVAVDPFERHDLGAAACGALLGDAERIFGGPPSQFP